MALGKNLKKKKLIPDQEEKESKKKAASKKVVRKKATAKASTAKKTKVEAKTAPKKKTAAKKVTAKKAPAKKELIKKDKPKKETKTSSDKVAPQKVVAKLEVPKEKVKEQEINQGLPIFIAKELHERKRQLRSKYEEEVKSLKGVQIQFVVFEVAGESYAIDIDVIKEVVPIPTLSKTPNTPSHIKGIANVRGNTYPVFDLATKFRVVGDEFPKFLLVIESKEVVASIMLSVLPVTLKTNGSNISGSLHMIEDASLDVSYIKGLIHDDEKLIYFLDIVELLRNYKAIVVPENMNLDA